MVVAFLPLKVKSPRVSPAPMSLGESKVPLVLVNEISGPQPAQRSVALLNSFKAPMVVRILLLEIIISPAKFELFVVVESIEPTVSCEPVAIRAEPSKLDVIIELGAKEVDPVPPLAMVLLNDPPPIQVPAIA